MGYNGNNRKLKDCTRNKRNQARITKGFSGLFANLFSPLISGTVSSLFTLEEDKIFQNLPSIVYAVVYIACSIIFHPFIMGCLEFAIEAWDSIFFIFSIIIIVPLFFWGASVVSTIFAIIDTIQWIKKLSAIYHFLKTLQSIYYIIINYWHFIWDEIRNA